MTDFTDFSTRFLGETVEDPVALFQTLVTNSPDRAWSAVCLLLQIVSEHEGADEETSSRIAPNETQRALLDAEDVEFCRSFATSESVGVRELVALFYWWAKEISYLKKFEESLEDLASRVGRPLPIEQFEALTAQAEELAVVTWRERIEDLRQVSEQPGGTIFLILVTWLFFGARAEESLGSFWRRDELLDPEEFLLDPETCEENANQVGVELSKNADRKSVV